MPERNTHLAAAGLAAAGLTYLFDPDKGARRRARVRDAAAHVRRLTRHAASTTGRDAAHRTQGAAAALWGLVRPDHPDDVVLVERVRAKLGRLVSHPHAVRVYASAGTIALEGPILTHEAEALIRTVQRMRGVQDVVDQLERHDEAGRHPALQGGRRRTGRHVDVVQDRWAPATRSLVGAGGLALAAAGVHRGGVSGITAAALGATLVGRALANRPFTELTGIGSHRPIEVQKTITINASAGEVFACWSHVERYPHFMSRVLHVAPHASDPWRSHWRIAGPAGVPVEFTADIRETIPNRLIAWRTLPGSALMHEGVVRFDEQEDCRTRVHVRLSYVPPAGWVGHELATAVGADPKHVLDQELLRMKTLIETGRAPHDARVHGH